MNIPEFLEQFFYRTTVAAFELCFSIRKNFQQRKLDLISLINVQVQVSTSKPTTTRASVFLAKSAGFFYHKIFEASR